MVKWLTMAIAIVGLASACAVEASPTVDISEAAVSCFATREKLHGTRMSVFGNARTRF